MVVLVEISAKSMHRSNRSMRFACFSLATWVGTIEPAEHVPFVQAKCSILKSMPTLVLPEMPTKGELTPSKESREIRFLALERMKKNFC